jgi:hypothetical protein
MEVVIMTTAAAPPSEREAEREDTRHFTVEDVKKAYGHNCTGMGERSTEQFAALNFGVEGPEEQSEFREAVDHLFAKRGESLDPIAWIMRRIANRETVIEKMMRMVARDEVPASHFGVLRHLFNDCDKAIKELCIVRDNLGRNEYQNNKDAAKIRAEAARQADIHFTLQKLYEGQGYGYVPAVDMLQPGIDLNREEAAARDIFRMRMMPKSPREDAILLEIAGLNKTIREQDKLRPDELSDKKVHPNFRWFNPKEYVDDEDIKYAGTGHYRDDAHFNRVIKAERIRNYNDVWTEANELIDGIMDAFDIRLGFVHESIGIPDKVQRALNGDETAIQILKEEVAKIKQERADRVARGEKERPNPDMPNRLTSMIMNYVPMLFTAFVTGWMMVCMTLGQVGMNAVQAAVAEQPQNVVITLRRDDSGGEIQKQCEQKVTQEQYQFCGVVALDESQCEQAYLSQLQIILPVAVITTERDDYYPEMVSPRSMTGGGSRDVVIHPTTTIIARCVNSPHAPPPVTDRGLSGLFPRSG